MKKTIIAAILAASAIGSAMAATSYPGERVEGEIVVGKSGALTLTPQSGISHRLNDLNIVFIKATADTGPEISSVVVKNLGGKVACVEIATDSGALKANIAPDEFYVAQIGGKAKKGEHTVRVSDCRESVTAATPTVAPAIFKKIVVR